MKQNIQHLMASAKAVIDTVSVHDAIECFSDSDTVFVDLRDSIERAEHGEIPGAQHAPRGSLEFYADPDAAMHNAVFSSGKRLILFCASGGRSALAAKTLYDMGIPNVAHLAGGIAAWREAGGPIDTIF